MLKKGDFIELDYTGRLKDDKVVFDTTSEQVAKDSNIHSSKHVYKPVIVCLGQKHLVKGLDDKLIGRKPGRYTFEVRAEDGFGRKTADLLKLIPMRLFSKDNVKPYVGLEVNVDNQLGVVRTVSSGRVIVDFNHPLAGKDLVYDVNVRRVVEDPAEKTKGWLELVGLPFEDVKVGDNKAIVSVKSDVPEKLVKPLVYDAKELIGLEDMKFKKAGNDKKDNKKSNEAKEEAES